MLAALTWCWTEECWTRRTTMAELTSQVHDFDERSLPGQRLGQRLILVTFIRGNLADFQPEAISGLMPGFLGRFAIVDEVIGPGKMVLSHTGGPIAYGPTQRGNRLLKPPRRHQGHALRIEKDGRTGAVTPPPTRSSEAGDLSF